MAFVSATRLHLRSTRYLVPFLVYSLRVASQAKKSRGFRRGALAGDAQWGLWTFTVWDSDADMRAFRNSGVHRTVMPKLLHWCDEASFAHWTSDAAEMPSSRDDGTHVESQSPVGPA
jgi:heme-degrading monooxygenase HmoA